MTKERLEQYQALKGEIELLDRQIDDLKANGPQYVSDSVTTAANFPYSKHTLVISGFEYGQYNRRLETIRAKRQRTRDDLIQELEYLENYIAAVDDSLVRQIMRLKYVEGMTWQKTAFRIHQHDEQYPRKKVAKYLQKYENDEIDELQS